MALLQANAHRALILSLALALLAVSPVPAQAKSRVYVVSDEAPTLCEIGILLYRKCGAARKIAEWNGIKKPYRVRVGQKLVLQEKPTLKRKTGREALLAYWRDHFGLPAVSAGHVETGKRLASKTPPVAELPEKKAPEKKVPEKKVYAPTFKGLVEEAKKVEVQRVEAIAKTDPEAPEILEAQKVQDIQAVFSEAREFFKQKNYDGALARSREIRRNDSKFLPAWLLELAVLRAQQKEDDARSFARDLLQEHPSAANLPVLRPYVGEGAAQ